MAWLVVEKLCRPSLREESAAAQFFISHPRLSVFICG
jgi:hypothetical protein